MYGIDIASYQSNINIRNVSCDFVIVKVSEGLSYVNPFWQQQVEQAILSGKEVGLYHLINGQSDGVQQALYFREQIKLYIGKCLLALDFEGDNFSNPGACYNFLKKIEVSTGVRPLIYMNASDEANHDWSQVANNNFGLWIANYGVNEIYNFQNLAYRGNLRNWRYPAMYQFSSKGKLNGYNGNLDLNIFYGEKKAWQAYGKTNDTLKDSEKEEISSMYWIDKFGVKWIKENGLFIANTEINLRSGANTDSNVIKIIQPNEAIKYDAKCSSGGYIWVRQPREDGTFGYLAVGKSDGAGKNIDPFGNFKEVN